MADTLSLISLVSFIIAGVCLGLAVIFWFVFRIQKVIGDLSGRTARKSIARMRTKNEADGSKVVRRRDANAGQGKSAPAVSSPAQVQLRETEPLPEDITEDIETGVLNGNAGVEDDEEDATVLLDGSDDTMLLSDMAVPTGKQADKKLMMLEEIALIHTDEAIE